MRTATSSGSMRAMIKDLLEEEDYTGLVELHRSHARVVRLLIASTYDKHDALSWRAMEAIGRISATMPEDNTRNLIQRLLWMMREESGTNAWSAGEIISEVVRNKPEPFEDIVPIVISFHDEPILRPGSLWCMIRVGEVRPDLTEPFEGVALEYLESGAPLERALSILALGALGKRDHIPRIEKLRDDKGMATYYEDGSLVEKTVGTIASETIFALSGRQVHPNAR